MKIAKEIGCTIPTVWNYLKKFNIKIRTYKEANMKYIDILTKQFLYKEYIINKKSIIKIAKEVGCSDVTVWNYLKIHKIKIRTLSESRKSRTIQPGHVDGRYANRYYCKDCLKQGIKTKISVKSGFYGQGRCKKHAHIFKWQDSEYRDRQIKASLEAQNISPNKPEKQLIKLLNKILPKVYKFVGNGKLVIRGFCPDFVNKDNDKIIEMYGDYWHNRKDWKERDKRRLIAYKKLGYQTLIIWEYELKDMKKVRDKILKFNKGVKQQCSKI